MIFQKFVFDSLEHTDHALNLIADSSLPGTLELIDIKKTTWELHWLPDSLISQKNQILIV